MPAQQDLYGVLGVARGASADDIKRAYRKLAMQFHPDQNPGDKRAEERFKEINQAYQVLGDPQKRVQYDQFGQVGGFGDGDPFQVAIDLGPLGDVFQGVFGDLFGARRGAPGRDLRYDLELTFEEAAHGCEKEISVPRSAPCARCRGSGDRSGRAATCPTCQGRGEIRLRQGFLALSRPCTSCGATGSVVRDPCRDCGGRGTVRRDETFSVAVPAGIEPGAVRTVRAKGAAGRGDAKAGDLHIYFVVRAHPFFERHGRDVHCTVPLSFAQATLGAVVDVPTIDGKVAMRVPAGTASGKTFRLRGKGIPSPNGGGPGDQHVTVTVEVPQALTERQRELVEQLAKELGEEVHPQQRTFLDKLRELFD